MEMTLNIKLGADKRSQKFLHGLSLLLGAIDELEQEEATPATKDQEEGAEAPAHLTTKDQEGTCDKRPIGTEAGAPATKDQEGTGAPATKDQEEAPATKDQGEPAKKEWVDPETYEAKTIQPEEVLGYLRKKYGIPEDKEERTEEQQQLAKSLSKVAREAIREATGNKSARSLADMKHDLEKQKFCEIMCTSIYWNSNEKEFELRAF